MTVLLVGGVAWIGAHDLDPHKPISSTAKPLNVQVVSLDWKWLFIYPEQGIASVNHLTVPVGTPISFELTSVDGHEQLLRAAAGQPDLHHVGNGDAPSAAGRSSWNLPGLSANFSGDGFADMRFTVDAVPAEQFAQWVTAARNSGPVLDAATYADLAKPSQAVAPFTYRCRRARSVQRHRERRNVQPTIRFVCTPSGVTEGRTMNLLGKLSWSAIPFDQPIIMGASAGMILAIVFVLLWVTLKGYWPYLWREWLTSVDHKRIGVMYCVLALIMMLRGFADAIMMRSQQAVAAGGAQGYLPPEHFDQIFSAHGTIMIFFMAMPFVIGLMNFAVPLQLGIRDVAFPTMNSVSLWLTASGIL